MARPIDPSSELKPQTRPLELSFQSGFNCSFSVKRFSLDLWSNRPRLQFKVRVSGLTLKLGR